MNIRHYAQCGNIENSITLVNQQTLMPDKTDDMGLWTFMKKNKRFWLLPIAIVVLLVGGLVVWEELSLAPSMEQNPIDPALYLPSKSSGRCHPARSW